MRSPLISLVLCMVFVFPGFSLAQGKSTLIRESVEFVLKKFGKEATDLGANSLTQQVEKLAIKHGDDGITAFRNFGPRCIRIVEEAGEFGTESVKLMAQHGNDALWVVAKKNRLAIFVKYGDDAAVSMMKHKEIVEPLLNSYGKSAASALKAVKPQNSRRIAMMSQDGELAKIGRTNELLEVVGKYGDRAMDFIWENKGALAVGATLTAFLLNPEPFLDNTIGKIGDVPGKVAGEAAKSMNWTLVVALGACIIGALSGVKMWLRHRVLANNSSAQP
jgi:hypothetical protein